MGKCHAINADEIEKCCATYAFDRSPAFVSVARLINKKVMVNLLLLPTIRSMKIYTKSTARMRRVSNIEWLNSDWSNRTRVVLSYIVNKSEKQNTTNKTIDTSQRISFNWISNEACRNAIPANNRQPVRKAARIPFWTQRECWVDSKVYRSSYFRRRWRRRRRRQLANGSVYWLGHREARCRCADSRQHRTMHTFVRLASLRRHCPCVRTSHTDVFVVRVWR